MAVSMNETENELNFLLNWKQFYLDRRSIKTFIHKARRFVGNIIKIV